MGPASAGDDDDDQCDSIHKFPWSCVSIRSKLGSGSFSSVYMVRIGDPAEEINGSTSHTCASGTSSSSLSESVNKEEEGECDRQDVGGNKNKSIINPNNYYALKKLDAKILTGKESKFMRALQDLAMESQILSQLRHPNIIRIHGVASGNPHRSGFFLLLDLLQKDTLKDYIHTIWNKKNLGNMQPWRNIFSRTDPSTTIPCPSLKQRIEDIAMKIAVAMSYVHSKNIVARDLKPGNIGFHPATGEPILFDFGFARTIQFLEEYTPCAAGSPAYMAPEIINIFNLNKKKNSNSQDTDMRTTTAMAIDSPVDYFAADVYSFSILLWELVTLQRPYGRSKQKAKMKFTLFGSGGSAEGTTTTNKELDDKDNDDKKSAYFTALRRRPSMDDVPSEVPSLHRLITSCWATDPNCRPTFTSILSSLRNEVLAELEDQNHSSSNGDGRPISFVDKRTTCITSADKNATTTSTKSFWKRMLPTQ